VAHTIMSVLCLALNGGFRLDVVGTRLVTQYWRHQVWLDDGILIGEANRLSGIPGLLTHGRLDLCTPLMTPWRLAQSWRGSELVIVSEAGHDTRDPGWNEAIVAATDRFGAGE
jgi:proline iminopeptidase